VLVRTDIPHADQVVQACHACVEAGVRFQHPGNCRMALLCVRDEEALIRARERAENAGIKMQTFFEPDPVDGEDHPMGFTAVCSEPVAGDQRKVFRKYALWKG